MPTATVPAFSGTEVKDRRRAAGLSLEALAQRAGLSVFTLSKIESAGGKRDPRASTVALLAHHLGCRIDDLFRAAS